MPDISIPGSGESKDFEALYQSKSAELSLLFSQKIQEFISIQIEDVGELVELKALECLQQYSEGMLDLFSNLKRTNKNKALKHNLLVLLQSIEDGMIEEKTAETIKQLMGYHEHPILGGEIKNYFKNITITQDKNKLIFSDQNGENSFAEVVIPQVRLESEVNKLLAVCNDISEHLATETGDFATVIQNQISSMRVGYQRIVTRFEENRESNN